MGQTCYDPIVISHVRSKHIAHKCRRVSRSLAFSPPIIAVVNKNDGIRRIARVSVRMRAPVKRSITLRSRRERMMRARGNRLSLS